MCTSLLKEEKKIYLKILNYWEMLLIHLFLSGFAKPIQGFKPTPSSQRLTYTPLTSLLPGPLVTLSESRCLQLLLRGRSLIRTLK